ncbi:MAG TPA: DNA repair protein RecO [Armatimonadota bacterium]
MTDSRLYTVTAIILRSRDYGEGHRLFSLLTREEGKIVAVARGVRKPKAKLAASLQHFALAEVQLAPGRRFDVITHVRVLNAFYGLRASIEAVSYASYFAELFDESLAERQPHPALFDLLTDALQHLAAGKAPELLARYVEISLIALAGYLPQLTACAVCQCPLAHVDAEDRTVWPTWLGFSVSQGGALCTDCLPKVPGARRIAAGTVQVAQLLLAKGMDCLDALDLSDRLRREIETTFRDYLEYRLERRLHSTRFLRDWGDGRGDIVDQEDMRTVPHA